MVVNWIIFSLYIVVYVVTAFVIIMDKKEPVKTLAWLLLLFLLPIIGCILYFFFGQDTRRRKSTNKYRAIDLYKSVEKRFMEQDRHDYPVKYAELIRMFVNQNHAYPFTHNEIEIYESGRPFFDAFLSAIDSAESHIHLEFFIFLDDEIGNRVADHIIQKAQEGVEVRVLYDDVACWNVKNRFWERMREGGVDVRSFMPVRYPGLTSKINYRNHRKIAVIDGKVAFMGGMNIADRYIKGTKEQSWRDTNIKISGRSVYGLQKVFIGDWYFMDKTLLSGDKYYPKMEFADDSLADNLIQIASSSAASRWPDIEQGYVRIINNAKKYIYIETPYFIPTQPVLFALQTAALGGIDVRVMVPEKCDNFLVNNASRSFFPDILKAGAKVYLYDRKVFNHSKVLICDDELATVGSVNIDSRSFETSMEVQAFIYSEDIVSRFRDMFENDMKRCTQFDINKNQKRSIVIRFWESVVRMLSPLL